MTKEILGRRKTSEGDVAKAGETCKGQPGHKDAAGGKGHAVCPGELGEKGGTRSNPEAMMMGKNFLEQIETKPLIQSKKFLTRCMCT